MASIHPFRALRPAPDAAASVSSVPYDVVSTDEARQLAAGNPLSFLHVTRRRSICPPDTDPYSSEVYDKARAELRDAARHARRWSSTTRRRSISIGCGWARTSRPGSPAASRSTSTSATSSRSTSGRGATRKTIARGTSIELRAQTGVVFLTYRADADGRSTAAGRRRPAPPLYDFTAADGVQHTLWRAGAGADRRRWWPPSRGIPALYIADGHHRAASAARARDGAARVRANAATARTRSSRWRFPTTRCRSCPTTGP